MVAFYSTYLDRWADFSQFLGWISSDANSWGHLWTMAGPMPVCRYRHRFSSRHLPVSV